MPQCERGLKQIKLAFAAKVIISPDTPLQYSLSVARYPQSDSQHHSTPGHPGPAPVCDWTVNGEAAQ